MANKEKRYVTATPTIINGKIHYISNAKVGDIVMVQKDNGIPEPREQFLPKKVRIIDETPFFFVIDTGLYKFSVLKSSIYWKHSILYFPS